MDPPRSTFLYYLVKHQIIPADAVAVEEFALISLAQYCLPAMTSRWKEEGQKVLHLLLLDQDRFQQSTSLIYDEQYQVYHFN